jgi:hypothetical protein
MQIARAICRCGSHQELSKRESHAKTNVMIALRRRGWPPGCRPYPSKSRGPTTTSNYTYLTPCVRERGSVGRDFQRIWCPAILDPFPCVAVHVEKSPWIGLEASNGNGSVGRHVAATTTAPAEAGAQISELGIGAELARVIAKAVTGSRTCPSGIFPFCLGR